MLFKQEGFVLNKCRHCGVVASFVTQQSKKVNYTKDYYWNMKEIDPISRLRYENLVNRIQACNKNGRLLDVGCGVGHFLCVARENQWHVTGVEVSKGACEIAQEIFGLNIFLGELPALNFKSESFDAVTMLESIEHIEKPGLYLKEIYKLLRKGGLLVISTPNFNGISRFLLGFKWRAVSPEHYHLFTVKTLKRILLYNGFYVKNVQAKNISINEIIGKTFFKRNFIEVDAYYRDKKLRQKLEDSRTLFLTKAIVNKILNITRLGDSLWIFAEKR